jgi:membrane glycosyltransferase
VRHQYFSQAETLFPLWPRIDPERAIRLFALTMGVLSGPKLLGWLSVVLSWRRLRAHGGLVRVTLGFAVEVVISAAIAPVQALIHCGVIADVLRGRSSGWKAQRREGASLSWAAALYAHRWHAGVGVALAAVAASISPMMLAWLAPAVVGMVLAAPMSKLVASTAVGRAVRRIGLLRTPEETTVPAIARAADELLPAYRAATEGAPDLAAVVADARLLEHHLALVDRGPPHESGSVDVVEAVAEKKVRDARSVEEAVAALTSEERARVLARLSLLRLLATVRKRAAASAAGEPRRTTTWWGERHADAERSGARETGS